MATRWLRNTFFVPGAGTIPQEASADQTFLVPKYPGAIDTTPLAVDNSTVLSSNCRACS